MTTSAIHTESLSRRFGRTVALDSLDLDVAEGSIYALVGANGAGKTTLIKVLMNVFGPSAGRAVVLGTPSRKVAGKAFQHIGYVSENQEMPSWMKVHEMLAYYRNFYPQWDTGLERQLVRQFELPLDRRIKHLSRGMKMKAAFASSLAYRPRLIVLDEPFSGLDPLVRDELIEVLIERAPDATIFLSSHDLDEIEGFSSHIGFLRDGRLLFSEELSDLTARFRAVTVTFEDSAQIPAHVPPSWLQVEAMDHVVRFIHSRFDERTSAREFAEFFPGARGIELDTMSLRSIFLATAKAGRIRDSEGAQFAPQKKEGQA